jgi:hypothetical protein
MTIPPSAGERADLAAAGAAAGAGGPAVSDPDGERYVRLICRTGATC